jgi:hypothetical protein
LLTDDARAPTIISNQELSLYLDMLFSSLSGRFARTDGAIPMSAMER